MESVPIYIVVYKDELILGSINIHWFNNTNSLNIIYNPYTIVLNSILKNKSSLDYEKALRPYIVCEI